jgi:hypothetical protein
LRRVLHECRDSALPLRLRKLLEIYSAVSATVKLNTRTGPTRPGSLAAGRELKGLDLPGADQLVRNMRDGEEAVKQRRGVDLNGKSFIGDVGIRFDGRSQILLAHSVLPEMTGIQGDSTLVPLHMSV